MDIQISDTAAAHTQTFQELLDTEGTTLPKVGEVITGTVIHVAKNEVHVDIDGIATGVARGFELIDESGDYSDLKVGDEVSATVLDLENENGQIELSFRSAGHKKAWDKLAELFKSGEMTSVKVSEANKGGLMVMWGNVPGFMPVSQLCPEHYPRIQGGDKSKILERLRGYVGQEFDVKVIDTNAEEGRLIVSEQAAWEEKQKDVLSQFNVGDVVEGVITVITTFGAFVEFGPGLEGLVHISELAWQRIDDPKDIVQPGQNIKAEIIKRDGPKIFLSMKKLITDPWMTVAERYSIGQKVKGKVLKINPFGFFVELDPEIHGLAHVSELSDAPGANPEQLATAGDTLEFTIVSIEPKEHRLGLSLKKQKKEKKATDPAVPTESAPAQSETADGDHTTESAHSAEPLT
ncbi:S1 RNA-binding domain-containing protein [Candidatus Uhrbacteria bacterium]|nr:S1 RNA-binding domain-containing protein [Candidatus Uhrbacteria bacterium]